MRQRPTRQRCNERRRQCTAPALAGPQQTGTPPALMVPAMQARPTGNPELRLRTIGGLENL